MQRHFFSGLAGSSVGFALVLLVLTFANNATAQSANRAAVVQAPPSNVDAPNATPISTTFTYQGQLKNGSNPVNGSCDLAFRLYDDPSVDNLIGSPITLTNVSIANGFFTVGLNFGSAAFTGDARWLAISVNCGSGFTPLTPRQALTPAPIAFSLPGLYTNQNSTSPNIIGGYSGNFISNTVVGGTISGGGASGEPNRVMADYATVGGGEYNTANGQYATIGGGQFSTASGQYATIGGGFVNIVTATFATVGGGWINTASGFVSTIVGGRINIVIVSDATIGGGNGNIASCVGAFVGGGGSATYNVAGNQALSDDATVAGGIGNTASGIASTISGGEGNVASDTLATIGGGYQNTAGGWYATVAGGSPNTAKGMNSFAAGHWAQALHDETVVWAANSNTPFASTGPGQFLIRAASVGINTNTPHDTLDVQGSIALSQLGSAGTTHLCINSFNEIGYCSSSLRYKNNVADLTLGLDAIAELRPVTFNLFSGRIPRGLPRFLILHMMGV